MNKLPSEDFLRLTELHYKKKYYIKKTHLSMTKIEGTKNQCKAVAEIVLSNDKEDVKISSEEQDFVEFAFKIQKIADNEGNLKLIRVKDTNKYYADIDFLVDKYKEKIAKARNDIITGKFKFVYDPEELLDKYLFSKRLLKSQDVPKLKSDYYYIFSHFLLLAEHFMLLRDKLLQKLEIKDVVSQLDKLYVVILKEPNSIKRYKLFKDYLDCDLTEIANKSKEESDYIKSLFNSLVIQSPVSITTSCKTVLDSYWRFCELLKPFVNFIRICIELENGKTPKEKLPYSQNVDIIKKSKYKDIIKHIAPLIRNKELHLSTEIDEKNHIINFIERKNRKKNIVDSIKFADLYDLFNKIQRISFPAIYLATVVLHFGTILLILQSGEYKISLLQIEN